MASHTLSSLTTWSWSPSPDHVKLFRSLQWTAVSVSAAVAGLLFARRLAGAFQQPLTSVSLVTLGVGLTMLLGVARWGGAVPKSGAQRGLFECLASLTVILLGVSVTLPDSPIWAGSVFWSLIVGGQVYGWTAFVQTVRAKHGHAACGCPEVADDGMRLEAASSPGDHSDPMVAVSHVVETREDHEDFEEPAEESASLPTGVSQRITRARSEDGGAIIEGLVRCDFVVGQRQQNLHVVFCPPLERLPELTAEQVDGPVAAIRPTLVETFGACWEVRLTAPSSVPNSVQIHFFAIERPAAHSTASA